MRRISKYILLAMLFLNFAISQNPEWDFDATLYSENASLRNISITIDGINQQGGQLAAFVGNEIRALDSNGGDPSTEFFGYWNYELSVWSNVVSGEIVTFKFYDDINNIVIDLNETYNFSTGDIIGDLYLPFNLTGTVVECDPILGDINGDFELNIQDIIFIVNLILEPGFPDDYYEIADMNQDGILNIVDIVSIINIILGN